MKEINFTEAKKASEDLQKVVDMEKARIEKLQEKKRLELEAMKLSGEIDNLNEFDATEDKTFCGKIENADAKERYEKILKLSKLLFANEYSVTGISESAPSPTHRNSCVIMDLMGITLFDFANKKRFEKIVCLADDVCFTVGPDGLRISFGIKDVWR